LNLNKIVIAVVGLSVLAGLALHQGNVGQLSVEDESILIGTAIDAQVETNSSEDASGAVELSGQDGCMSEMSAQDEKIADDCERDIADENLPNNSSGHQTG